MFAVYTSSFLHSSVGTVTHPDSSRKGEPGQDVLPFLRLPRHPSVELGTGGVSEAHLRRPGAHVVPDWLKTGKLSAQYLAEPA